MIDNEAIENLNDEQILNLYDDILQFKENKFLSDICPTEYSVFENVYVNVDGTKGENICTILCETKGLKF